MASLLADPSVRVAALACVALATLCWLVSIATRNYSQVDRLWSLAPVGYVGWFAASSGFRDLRLDLMALLVLAWGARLTYNFWRKGGYRAGSEDYRWPILRARLGPLGFQLFNATFIAPFQNLLLLLLALPAAGAKRAGAPLNLGDVALAVVFVVLLAGETIADNQQWRFQADKHARRARGEPVTAEFLTTGLFRYSRHPAFFCEISIWWSVYAFSLAAGAPLGWTLAGPLLLTLLFHGSTTMTERISRSKYPAYEVYQRSTSRLVPLPR